ncbi:hypothetical protein ACFQVD_18065 [Streptosporangium amethystogenes subsp. fukuiense]|uniref:Uncharacterized protein n=1 Tax=Streptosporangium amethystogenes subsp. fukuiense TaxID=698418 RepID=A0ABW2T0S5_9ACTN
MPALSRAGARQVVARGRLAISLAKERRRASGTVTVLFPVPWAGVICAFDDEHRTSQI